MHIKELQKSVKNGNTLEDSQYDIILAPLECYSDKSKSHVLLRTALET